jgi:sugar transferase (PEP-CTERM system associated)
VHTLRNLLIWSKTVIRLFHVHYPVRVLVLMAMQVLVVFASFGLGVFLKYGQDSYLVLNFEYGYYKILAVTIFVLLFSHWLDLYDLTPSTTNDEIHSQLLLVPGLVAVTLAVIGLLFPAFIKSSSFPAGLAILTLGLFGWRQVFTWLGRQPYLRERVYVLGTGDRAQRLVSALPNSGLGIEVVGWSGDIDHVASREEMASHLQELARRRNIHRVIVAFPDRRGTIPVDELLQLKLTGAKIEEATTWLEKIYGRIEVDHLYPSWLIFAEGFRFSGLLTLLRRLLSSVAAAILLILVLPLIPFIVLAIKLDSRGRILYRQERVGFGGAPFFCYKFRTMREDAEADTGPTWAGDDDPRITRTGRFLRASRLDEIPQLWNVFRGDMAFVGPRPERPEFVEWLSRQIPYYSVRNSVRPGITGWAQIRYKYGNTLEDAKEKLQYDLYYIKNVSIGLDLLIMFQTIKIVTLGRGAQ